MRLSLPIAWPPLSALPRRIHNFLVSRELLRLSLPIAWPPFTTVLRNIIILFFCITSMPTKGGRRQREKRLRFQVKSALISNQDPFPYFQKLAQLLDQDKPVDSPREPVYTLNKLEVNLTFPSYKTIPKHDPRRFAYKLRDLFGTGFKVTLPLNYPVLPSESHP